MKGRTAEPMAYTTQTGEAHTALDVTIAGRKSRDEMKAKMQKAQFVMGIEAPKNETSSSIVGKITAQHANSHSVAHTSDSKKISNIVLGSASYNSKMPTESHASYQRPVSEM